ERGVLLAPISQSYNGVYWIAPTAVAMEKHFALLLRTDTYDRDTGSSWASVGAVVFPSSTDLSAGSALPRAAIITQENGVRRSLAAVSRGGTIALAYDRLGGAGTGSVPRVSLRLFGEVVARHRAAH